MKSILSFALVILIAFPSCKKEPASNNCAATAANLAGTYSIVKVEANIATPFPDITNQYLRTCQRDDKFELKTDGTVAYSDAGTACDPNGSVSGTWSLSSAGKVSVSAGSIDVSDADIVSFNCTTLVLLYPTTYLGGAVDLYITVRK